MHIEYIYGERERNEEREKNWKGKGDRKREKKIDIAA